MGSAIRFRGDYSSGDLRRLARVCREADQVWGLLAFAFVPDDASILRQRRPAVRRVKLCETG